MSNAKEDIEVCDKQSEKVCFLIQWPSCNRLSRLYLLMSCLRQMPVAVNDISDINMAKWETERTVLSRAWSGNLIGIWRVNRWRTTPGNGRWTGQSLLSLMRIANDGSLSEYANDTRLWREIVEVLCFFLTASANSFRYTTTFLVSLPIQIIIPNCFHLTRFTFMTIRQQSRYELAHAIKEWR